MRQIVGRVTGRSNVVAFPMAAKAVERLAARKSGMPAHAVSHRPMSCGGAWYHEEAIAEDRAERNRKADH